MEVEKFPTFDSKSKMELKNENLSDNPYAEAILKEIKVTADKKGKLSGAISKAEKGKPDNLGKVTWKFMSTE